MKTVQITNPHQYEIVERPVPTEIGPYEVLIKMKAAGVCGSDGHLFLGSNPCSTYPRIPGHENAGEIFAVGSKVTKTKVGDHIVVDLVIACGHCYQCSIGRRNVCETVTVRGSSADGGWREYFVVHEDDVTVISPDIPWKDAALIEPFAIGEHCTSRGRICEKDTVLVQGAGTIGAIVVQVCKSKGAKVICTDRSDKWLNRAKEYGADEVINSRTEDVVKRVLEITEGHGCTAAIDAACYPGSLANLLRPGIVGNAGRIVPMGFMTQSEEISQADINRRELEIIGSRMSAYQFGPAAQKMADGVYNLNGLATNYIPFSNIAEVFEHLEHPDPNVKKMVILFDE